MKEAAGRARAPSRVVELESALKKNEELEAANRKARAELDRQAEASKKLQTQKEQELAKAQQATSEALIEAQACRTARAPLSSPRPAQHVLFGP